MDRRKLEIQKIRKKHDVDGANVHKILAPDKPLDEHGIELMYDIRTGIEAEWLNTKQGYRELKENHGRYLANIIKSLGSFSNVMEAGIGEGLTCAHVMKHLDIPNRYGFDLSLSRLMYANTFLKNKNVSDLRLNLGSLFNIPFCDNSMDIVYTAQSIEPNGGHETEILKELFRVTRKFLILVEPDDNFSGEEGKAWVKKYGYCRNLKQHSESLGYKVLRYEKYPFQGNPLNTTSLIIIEKDSDEFHHETYACPLYGTPLQDLGETYFNPKETIVYPVIYQIPILLVRSGIYGGLVGKKT